jgi:hypothetical protein
MYKNRPGATAPLSTIVSPSLAEPIPLLFSKEAYPLWVKRFYQKTGQDLALLQFLNQHVIYLNSAHSLHDVESDFFPLQQGHYQLVINGGPIFTERPRKPARLLIKLYTEKSTSKTTQLLSVDLPVVFPLETREKLTFVKIQLLDLRENNRLVEEVILKPDYRKYVEQRINRVPN